ncbi:MAG: hypothetical protein JNM14_00305 [Ferruginibacter sp.]|nr:hypothetical protein [Ferruginibacter sp.]
MKKKKLLHLILVAFILLWQQTNTYAQINAVKWQPWMQHPCYKGLSISVRNMGWAKQAEGYLWGVRFRNDYDTAVTFKFGLTIDTEKIKGGTSAVYKLKAGDTWTEGADSMTAHIFKTASIDWAVDVGELCFDGMHCGGKNDCYAICDSVEKKINQPCGLEANTAIRPGVWISMAGTGSEIQSKIEITQTGLIFTRSGISFEFLKISADEFEWVHGKGYQLKFKDNTHAILYCDGDHLYPQFVFKPGSSLSGQVAYKNYEDASFFEGEWINNTDKKKMKITGTKEGLSLKKSGEAISRLYIIMPDLSFRSASEKDKIMSLSGKNYETLVFYDGLKSVDTYTRLKTFVLKKTVGKQ